MLHLAVLLGALPGSLRRLASLGLALAANRLELFSVEFKQEQVRFLSLLLWGEAGLVLSVVGLVLALMAVVWAVPPDYRLLVLALAAAAFLLAAALVLISVHRRVTRCRMPFSETLGQFNKDRECL